MKGNNFSKKFNGQIQTMGKGGIKEMSNGNAIKPIQNYNSPNMNYGNQMGPMYPMNNQYQYPMMMPNQYNNQMMNNNYQPQNNMGMRQNNYENSKNRSNNINSNNPMVRNAKMILNNNMGNREKAKSARRNDVNKSNDVGYQGADKVYIILITTTII